MVKTREVFMKIKRMSIEEKLARLSEVDKAYVQGYVERAVSDYQKQKKKHQAETLPETKKQKITGAYVPKKDN